MENFVTVEMDDAGKPKRRIEADSMAFHADRTVELSNPRYVLYRADGQPWHVALGARSGLRGRWQRAVAGEGRHLAK